MEPANLNRPTDEDAALAAIARAQSPEIADDGFSDRVLAALPPAEAKSATAPWLERWPWLAYVGGGIAGTVLAGWRVSSNTDLSAAVQPLADACNALLIACTGPWVGVALGITVTSLLITFAVARPLRRA